MKKFAFLSDILFALSVSGIFTLVLFRNAGLSLPLALFLAVICGALTATSVGAFLSYRRKNLYLKRSDETIAQKLVLHLALLSDEAKTDYFIRLLSEEGEPVKRFGRLRIFSKTEFYFLKFSLSPLVADEIPKLARLKTGKKKILLCNQIEEAALHLCQKLDIEVRTSAWTYDYIKKRGALPEAYLGDGEVSAPKRRVKLWFSKKNAKRFLVGGTLVLLVAGLTPFSYYYLLLGCILLLASVFVRIFGYS